ncbi:MAG: hypothetical protein LBQ94_04165 [Treponema sp.]|jgi:hypothetical protein|nr:hypothetical protein [Treponema sp.]
MSKDKNLSKNKHFSYSTINFSKKESSLHRSLKFRYSENGVTETPVGDFVCDGLGDDGEYIEVQTGSFGPLKEKVNYLTQSGKVRIIHPIISQKRIKLYNAEGGLIRERKSPRKGCPWDLFNALLYAPELPLLKNLAIELAIVDVIEKRLDDGRGSWRRRGVSITDRLIGAWHQTIVLAKPKDYKQFIPFRKNERFSVRDLAEKAGITVTLARKAVYVLAKMGLIERTGKQGNAYQYRKT